MPKEYEYHEGKQAQEDFEEGMKALFQVPKDEGGSMAKVLCEFWCNPKDEADEDLRLRGKRVCRWCADSESHAHPTPRTVGFLPCPVVNEKHEVLPYGEYPNIDWS